MSIDRSGVVTWTVPSRSRQCCRTPCSAARTSVDAPASDDGARLGGVGGLAQEHDDLRACSGLPARGSPGGRRTGPFPHPPRPRARSRRPRPAGSSAPPLRPRNSVRSAVQALCRPPRSRNATRRPNSMFQGLRARSAPVSGSRDVMTWCAASPLDVPSVHSDVGGHRQAPRPAGPVVEREQRHLDGIVERHELHQVGGDAVVHVLEGAVPVAVTDDDTSILPRGSATRSGTTRSRWLRRGCRWLRPRGR